MAPTNLAFPKASLVLVSGANGYIGSHVVDQLLHLGYNVRGTVRSERPWLNKYFEDKFGKDRFETIVVPSLDDAGAFVQATKGASGFIHVASDTSMGTDPNKVITTAVNGVKHALEAAAAEPSIKRFVLTSSSSAALAPPLNTKAPIETDSWNEPAVAQAWDSKTPEGQKAVAVYSASKTEAEKAAWKWLGDHEHHFEFNTVLPNLNLGAVLHPKIPGSTMGWMANILKGDKTIISLFPPQHYVNVVDTAKLHIIALLEPHVKNERIFAYAHEYNYTDIINIFKKLRPDNKDIPAPPENEARDLADVVGKKRARELLKSFYGQDDWVSLEKSLKEGIESLGL